MTQQELNDLALGTEFNLDERYAQIYTAMFVCFAYSTGLPLLMPVLFFTIVLIYWIDKALFTTFYVTPPAYDAALGRAFTSLLPFTIVIHLAFGVWMLSNNDIW